MQSIHSPSAWRANPLSGAEAVPSSLQASLAEIRLRRSEQMLREEPVEDERDHLWVPDTDYNRARLAHAASLGNLLFGPLTHWIEERQA